MVGVRSFWKGPAALLQRLYAFLSYGELWSFWNGLLSLPLCAFEILRYYWKKLQETESAYRIVPGLWRDRNNGEIFLYFLGCWVFLLTPGIGTFFFPQVEPVWFWTSCAITLVFAVVVVVTLFDPVGARTRYEWIRPGQRGATDYDRLFLGLMPVDMFLTASGEGTKSCLFEFLWTLVSIVLLAASSGYVLWTALDVQAFRVPSAESTGPFDFIYWSVVTLATVGYGDIHPLNAWSQALTIIEIGVGGLYILGLLPLIMQLLQSTKDGKRTAARLDGTSSKPIDDRISRGRRWLLEHQAFAGGWSCQLSRDLLATVCGCAALYECRAFVKNAAEVSDVLRRCVERSIAEGDGLTKTVYEVLLGGSRSEHSLRATIRRAQSLHQHGAENADVLVGSCQLSRCNFAWDVLILQAIAT